MTGRTVCVNRARTGLWGASSGFGPDGPIPESVTFSTKSVLFVLRFTTFDGKFGRVLVRYQGKYTHEQITQKVGVCFLFQ